MKYQNNKFRKIKYSYYGDDSSFQLPRSLFYQLFERKIFKFDNQKNDLKWVLKSPKYDALLIEGQEKSEVIKDLTDVTDQVKIIGEADLIQVINGKLFGFNTQYFGIIKFLEKFNIQVENKDITILCDENSIKTLKYALNCLKPKSINEIIYSANEKYQFETDILINMVDFDKNRYNIDLVNSSVKTVIEMCTENIFTRLYIDSKNQGIEVFLGIYSKLMRYKKAFEIMQKTKFEDADFESYFIEYLKSLFNIVLVGMPGSGKTTIGNKISKLTKRAQLDLDREFTSEYGVSPAQYLRYKDEFSFRKKESKIVIKFGLLRGKVISTSGGVVQLINNYYHLKKNSIIFRINRDLEKLSTYNRPLSKGGIRTLVKMSEDREFMYSYFTDFVVKNTGDFIGCAYEVFKIFNELTFDDFIKML